MRRLSLRPVRAQRSMVGIHGILQALFILIFPTVCLAESIKISVSPYSEGQDLLTLDHPLSAVLRSAVGGALVRESPLQPAGFSYWYSDALRSSANGRSWSVRIRAGTILQSGRQLSEADVVYSLEMCEKLQNANIVSQIRSGYFIDIQKPGRWVTVELKERVSLKSASELPVLLAACTLLDRTTHPVFGKDHGQGTNFSTVGPFYVHDFRPLRAISLHRRTVYHDEFRAGAAVIDVSVHKSDEKALSTLRSGGVDLFFTNNQDVVREVQKDETIQALQCSIYYVVFRKGLRVICQPELEVSLLSYH